MGTSLKNSKMMQNMIGGKASQAAMSAASSYDQSTSGAMFGKNGGSVKQMIGNVASMFGGNTAQKSRGNQNTSSQSNNSTVSPTNIAQSLGDAAQQITRGTAQAAGSIAQTIAPQVGQVISNMTTGSQDASGKKTPTQITSGMNGAVGANGSGKIASKYNEDTNSNLANGVTASAVGNKQATSVSKAKIGATKPLTDGVANKANMSKVAASAFNATDKTTDKDAPTSDILQ